MRFILAVLMLAGWAVGQDNTAKDLPKLSDIQISGTAVMTMASPTDTPKTILNCDPVLTDKGEWTPHVTNCRLENGASLDDVMNSMIDMQQMERKQATEDRRRLTKGWQHAAESGEKGIRLALKSSDLYKSAYLKCVSAVSDFRRDTSPLIPKEVKK